MASKPNKTEAGEVSVGAFLAAADPARRADGEVLRTLMEKISGEPARMWGPSIVGFGVHRYRYDSGREGDICKIGFSPRKPALVLYGLGAGENADEVAALGKVTTGKGCIYIKRLAEVDLARLEALIEKAWRR